MIDPDAILRSRRELNTRYPKFERREDDAAEGGCGVVGLASEVPVAGRHLFASLEQMRNRGNGKGGGVALVGLDPKQFGVASRTPFQQVVHRTGLIVFAYRKVQQDALAAGTIQACPRYLEAMATAVGRLQRSLGRPPPTTVAGRRERLPGWATPGQTDQSSQARQSPSPGPLQPSQLTPAAHRPFPHGSLESTSLGSVARVAHPER